MRLQRPNIDSEKEEQQLLNDARAVLSNEMCIALPRSKLVSVYIEERSFLGALENRIDEEHGSNAYIIVR